MDATEGGNQPPPSPPPPARRESMCARGCVEQGHSPAGAVAGCVECAIHLAHEINPHGGREIDSSDDIIRSSSVMAEA